MSDLSVRVENQHPRGVAAARRIRRRAAQYLRALGCERAELSVLLVTDRAIRTLNRRWRRLDRSTDVLSFGKVLPAPPGDLPLLGDVVISLDAAVRRSRGHGRLLGTELDRYLAHGLLHLLGYEHHRPLDAGRMAAKEAELTGASGLVGSALRYSDRPSGSRLKGKK